MHPLPSLFILLGSLDLVLSNALPQITNRAQKRDGGVLNINLGNLDVYTKTITGVPTPAGNSFALYPTDAKDIKPEGCQACFGDDLQKKLQDSMNSNCAAKSDQKCMDGVLKILGVGGVDVEKSAKANYLSTRQTPQQAKAASAFLTAIAAIVIELWQRLGRDSRPIPVEMHVPAIMLSSLDSASTATEIIYKTADDDASPISAKVTATDTASGGLKTLSADGDGHHKGDIEIDAPNNDVGEALNNFFKKEKQCNANTKKRGVELDKRVDTDLRDCLVNGFNDIMNAMGNGQPLQGLRDTAMQVARNFPLPTFDNQQYAAAFGQALVAGAMPNGLPRLNPNIGPDQIVSATTFIFLLSTANVNHQVMQDSKLVLAQENLLKLNEQFKVACPAQGDNNFPNCDLPICKGTGGFCTVDPLKSCACGDGKCPTKIEEKPLCPECKGENSKCTSGDQKDCDCIEEKEPFAYMLDHPEWLDTVWQLQQQFGPNTFGLPYREKGPECSDTDHPSEVLKTVFNNGILPDCKDVKDGNDGSNNDAPKTCRDTSKDTPDTNKRSTVYDTFCKDLGKDHKAMIVDGHGNPIPTKKQSLLKARTPPVYSDPNIENTLYTFALVWEGGDGSCDFDCLKTWDTITSSCGHYGSGQNLMTMKGSYETGCGKYSYEARSPPKSDPVKTLPKCQTGDYVNMGANGGKLDCDPN